MNSLRDYFRVEKEPNSGILLICDSASGAIYSSILLQKFNHNYENTRVKRLYRSSRPFSLKTKTNLSNTKPQ